MNTRKNKSIKYAAISDSGRFRKENQDNLYCMGKYNIKSERQYRCNGIVRDNALFAVADGMGGEANGAAIALGAVCGLISLIPPIINERLIEYLYKYNSTVCEMIECHNGERMGATFASLSIHDGIAETLNIGDSRIYLFRDKELRCISKDDTLVRPLLENGVLSAEEARTHPDRHKLSQHIGVFPDELLIEPHTKTFAIEHGDVFLICTDGLTDVVEDRDISMILSQKTEVCQKTTQLYDLAYPHSKDNITIIVVEII